MGKEQSKLTEDGYTISEKTENYIIATKGDDSFFIKMINLHQISRQNIASLNSDIDFLKKTDHPHIVNIKNSLEDEAQKVHYVVMDHCKGGNFADEIKKAESLEEDKALSWITEICIALKVIHEANLHHKNLTPKNILFTEFGLVCIAGSGNIHKNSRSPSKADSNTVINYLAPEVFTGTYEAKSDIWSVGCLLYELCTKKQAFAANTPDKLIPKIICGPSPRLSDNFSPELADFLSHLLQNDPQKRPTSSEILQHPVVLKCLMTKSKTTVMNLYTKLKQLRDLADSLERIHEGTTIGSLAGGVIGAVGGITSIVGLVLAPFTLGASLIVTGVGVGVATLGGVAAGASNITNMVNQSSDRKAVHSIIKEFEQKIKAVVTWLLEINSSLTRISSQCPQTSGMDSELTNENLKRVGIRAGKGLGGIAELVRLANVLNIGKIAAQTSRAVRVAEVATGVLSGLFVAVDIFFIAMDAKEIHHIKQAREIERKKPLAFISESEIDDPVSISNQTLLQSSSVMQESNTEDAAEAQNKSDPKKTGVRSEIDDTVSISDQTLLQSSSVMEESNIEDASEAQNKSDPKKTGVRSEIMKFVLSVRQSADDLEKTLKEIQAIISSIPVFQEKSDLGCQNMN